MRWILRKARWCGREGGWARARAGESERQRPGEVRPGKGQEEKWQEAEASDRGQGKNGGRKWEGSAGSMSAAAGCVAVDQTGSMAPLRERPPSPHPSAPPAAPAERG
eukprot:scaffold120506_cov36-Tisochrysis_lutea.AAC.5